MSQGRIVTFFEGRIGYNCRQQPLKVKNMEDIFFDYINGLGVNKSLIDLKDHLDRGRNMGMILKKMV